MSVVTILNTRNHRMNIDTSNPDVQRTLRILRWNASSISRLLSGTPMVVSTKEFQALLPYSIKTPAAPARPAKPLKRIDPDAPTATEKQALARAQRTAIAAGKDYMSDFISDYRNNIQDSGLDSFDQAPESFSSDIAGGILFSFPDLNRSPRRSMFHEIIADYVSSGMHDVLRKSGL